VLDYILSLYFITGSKCNGDALPKNYKQEIQNTKCRKTKYVHAELYVCIDIHGAQKRINY